MPDSGRKKNEQAGSPREKINETEERTGAKAPILKNNTKAPMQKTQP
ncbi:hypothetical protein [Plesiomonas shigelloides]|nr:hypothetical protein [Plesiomonas shigelloides]